MTPRRVLDIDSGVAMVVTDLHGAEDVYRLLRDTFLHARAQGTIDRLVICGDVIHSEGPAAKDKSLSILIDIMKMQVEFGSDRVILLLGNHEVVHIYGVLLAKGNVEYTPRFEASLARLDQYEEAPFKRAQVINFLEGLPFYARTKAGVLLTHAGATQAVTSQESLERLLNFDHRAILEATDQLLQKHAADYEAMRKYYADSFGLSYDELARRYLAVSGPDDPRYNDLLRGFVISRADKDFNLLWDALFGRNEIDMGIEMYRLVAEKFLAFISASSPHPQRIIVAGHIAVQDGYAEVTPNHLRIASYTHAIPSDAACYLLLDCAQPVETAADLIPGLRPVFE